MARSWRVLLALAAALAILPARAAGDSTGGHRDDGWGRSAEYDYAPPPAGSYRLPVIKPAADGVVLDERGRRRSLRALLHGRITVLGFVYLNCTDPRGCPLTLSLLQGLHVRGAEDPALGEALQLVTLSFDAEHDTPAAMATQAAAIGARSDAAPPWRFLTTAGGDGLAALLAAYDQAVGRKADRDDPFGPLRHQLRVYLIDREARIRNIYTLGFLDRRLVLADVRTLMAEDSGPPPD